jgi:hypothetical protein
MGTVISLFIRFGKAGEIDEISNFHNLVHITQTFAVGARF